MLCFDPVIITVFVLLFESTHAVFYATKMDAVSTTGLPRLSELNQRIFHENGFHGEVFGFAAKREEECGIVLLVYACPATATIVLATRLKNTHCHAVGETIHTPVEVLEPVTVVEIPKGLDPIIFETSKMAERVRMAQKYKDVSEIGHAAKESFERLEEDRTVRFLPPKIFEDGAQTRVKRCDARGEEPSTSYDHIEEDALERERIAVDVMEAESTPKSQAIQSFEASKAAKQGTSRTATPKTTTSTFYTRFGDEAFEGGPVETVFKTAPNVELMFSVMKWMIKHRNTIRRSTLCQRNKRKVNIDYYS
ncbi:unnamed protein product [Cylicocyclus nassatus]|uniref:Uncharacterized protein n=1 Tax=Cylicocyclus nassatus TaxID=53992 RepID=A0AA36DSB2_CYLNA|nr:unnamed protein product [Cylicocyclus nassatus]